MCIYSTISKKVGWTSGKMMIPDVDVVKILYREVQEGSQDAFENIFRWYRFCESPHTIEEVESVDLIFNAYQIGRKMFEGK